MEARHQGQWAGDMRFRPHRLVLAGATVIALASGWGNRALAQEGPGGDPGRPAPPATAPPARKVAEPDTPWSRGVTPVRRAEAERLVEEGANLATAGNFARATLAFQRALQHWSHPAIWFNLAYCQINLDRSLEAYESLKEALRHGAAPFRDPRHFQDARTYLRLILARLSRLKVRCWLDGAQVTLDGKLLFVAPGGAEVVLAPGAHRIGASRPGHVTVTRTLVLLPGREVQEEIVLAPLHRSGRVSRRWPTWTPWMVFGAGVVASAVAIPLLARSRSDARRFDDRFALRYPHGTPLVDPALLDLRSRARAENLAGVAFLAAGGAVLAAGLTLLGLNTPRARREAGPVSWWLSPTPGGGMAGARVRY